MAVGVKSFSTTASSNGSADANINFAENQLAPTVNNSARALMAAIAALYDQVGGGATHGGSSNAYTVTMPSVGTWASYAVGDIVMIIANHSNTGAATLNVDGLGATAIKKNGSTALVSGDIVSGGMYMLAYDGTNFQIIGGLGNAFQPLDATLTALAGLTISNKKVIVGTGADAFTLYDVTGSDLALVSGTAGTNGNILSWDANGDAVDGGIATTAIVTLTGTQTLTNKTLTSPVISTISNTGTLTLPTSTTTLVGRDTTDTLTNKTISGTSNTLSNIATSSLATKSGADGTVITGTAGTNGNLIYWNVDGDAVDSGIASTAVTTLTGTQTLTNKTLTSPTINTPTISGGTASVRMVASSATTGTLTSADANDHIIATGNITIPASVFTARDVVTIDANGTARTITRGSGLAMYFNGTNSASVTLAANGVCSVIFRSATVCIINGNIS